MEYFFFPWSLGRYLSTQITQILDLSQSRSEQTLYPKVGFSLYNGNLAQNHTDLPKYLGSTP